MPRGASSLAAARCSVVRGGRGHREGCLLFEPEHRQNGAASSVFYPVLGTHWFGGGFHAGF